MIEMTQQSTPFVSIHPGEIIKEEIECRGISQRKLSDIMAIQYTMLNEILNGKRTLSIETALMFEAALGISAEMLIGIQAAYSLQNARKSPSLLDRFEQIRSSYAAAML